MPPKTRFCKEGHDTHVVGRYNKGRACKQCTREKAILSYRTDPKRSKQWKKDNLVRVNKSRNKWRMNNLKSTRRIGRTWAWKRQGIINLDGSQFTQIDYDRLYQIQQGKCKICGQHQTELKQALCIDHDHKTGFVRGLLCQKHNKGLGHFDDDVLLLEKTIEYLNLNLNRNNICQ